MGWGGVGWVSGVHREMKRQNVTYDSPNQLPPPSVLAHTSPPLQLEDTSKGGPKQVNRSRGQLQEGGPRSGKQGGRGDGGHQYVGGGGNGCLHKSGGGGSF